MCGAIKTRAGSESGIAAAAAALARKAICRGGPSAELARTQFKNLRQNSAAVDSSNERILVLIGAGHTKLLRQFVTEAGDFDLEKPGKYL